MFGNNIGRPINDYTVKQMYSFKDTAKELYLKKDYRKAIEAYEAVCILTEI